jgi:hypothetical protein
MRQLNVLSRKAEQDRLHGFSTVRSAELITEWQARFDHLAGVPVRMSRER